MKLDKQQAEGDLQFLHAYLHHLRESYECCDRLSPNDLQVMPHRNVGPTELDPELERVARLADANGLDGSVFRGDLLRPSDPNPLSRHTMQWLRKQIEIVPRIIAKIEQAGSHVAIPNGAKLLTVPQVAQLLQWGESTVRERDRKGCMPRHIKLGGTIQWNADELNAWVKQGCPQRAEWERNRSKWMEVNDATA